MPLEGFCIYAFGLGGALKLSLITYFFDLGLGLRTLVFCVFVFFKIFPGHLSDAPVLGGCCFLPLIDGFKNVLLGRYQIA